MTGLVLRKVTSRGMLKLRLVPAVHKVIGKGLVKLERVICPACGQQVEAVASDGRLNIAIKRNHYCQ